MKRLCAFLYAIIMIIPLIGFSQSAIDIDSIEYNGGPINVAIDPLGNLYISYPDGRFTRVDTAMEVSNPASSYLSGELLFADVRNPFKIMLFDKTHQSICFLDNYLNLQSGPFNLSNDGLTDVTLACSSYNDGYWVFDGSTSNLIRFSSDRIISDRVENLSSLPGEWGSFNWMIERGEFLCLGDPEHGVLVLDRFGNYMRHVSGKPIDIALDGDILYLVEVEGVMAINLKTMETSLLETIAPHTLGMDINNRFVVFIYESVITYFRVK